jgi:hypothetical protein
MKQQRCQAIEIGPKIAVIEKERTTIEIKKIWKMEDQNIH